MMYNPYNWNIKNNKKKPDMKMDVFPGSMTGFHCILEELGRVSNELEMTRIKYMRLKKDFEETEDEMAFLENKKKALIEKIYED